MVALVNTILQLIVAFGVNLSSDQQAAIVGVVNAGLVSTVAITNHWREVRPIRNGNGRNSS